MFRIVYVRESKISFYITKNIYGELDIKIHSVINDILFSGSKRLHNNKITTIEDESIEGLLVFGKNKHNRYDINKITDLYPELKLDIEDGVEILLSMSRHS